MIDTAYELRDALLDLMPRIPYKPGQNVKVRVLRGKSVEQITDVSYDESLDTIMFTVAA
jgi:hypothetical protein